MDRPLDYTKDYKELYLPKSEPVIIDVPGMPFITIDGAGDPNGEAFAEVVSALYSFSYTIKMSYKGGDAPKGYFPYKVFPLEGVWDLNDKSLPFDKSNFAYTMMIRQPDFVTAGYFEKVREILKEKKPNPNLDAAKFETLAEGLCCQMLHIGSYDDEPVSFARMEAFCMENGFKRISKAHREIYLSDPGRTEKSRLKTVLRFRLKRNA
jgi:hypothetical protein